MRVRPHKSPPPDPVVREHTGCGGGLDKNGGGGWGMGLAYRRKEEPVRFCKGRGRLSLRDEVGESPELLPAGRNQGHFCPASDSTSWARATLQATHHHDPSQARICNMWAAVSWQGLSSLGFVLASAWIMFKAISMGNAAKVNVGSNSSHRVMAGLFLPMHRPDDHSTGG